MKVYKKWLILVMALGLMVFQPSLLLGSDPLPPAMGESIYVVDNRMDSVIEFDGTTGALIGTFASGGGGNNLYGLACGPNGNLFVSMGATDQVVEFNGTTGAFVRIFASGNKLNNPTGLIFGLNGNLLVSNRDSGTVDEFDGATGEFVRTFASGGGLASGPFSLAFGPNGNLFVTSGHFMTDPGGVIEFNGTTGALIGTFASVAQPRGLTFGPNGNLFVASPSPDLVTEFDGSTGILVRMFSDGLNHPHGVAFGPNGNLFVSNYYGGNVVQFDIGTGTLIGVFIASGLVNPVELKFGPSSGPCCPMETSVLVDIKPESCPNPLNKKSKGVTPMAILGTADFDVTEIDVATLRINGASPVKSAVQDVATPYDNEFGDPVSKYECTIEAEDGYMDLTLKFKTQDILDGLDTGVQIMEITGTTLDGTPIKGQDVVWVK